MTGQLENYYKRLLPMVIVSQPSIQRITLNSRRDDQDGSFSFNLFIQLHDDWIRAVFSDHHTDDEMNQYMQDARRILLGKGPNSDKKITDFIKKIIPYAIKFFNEFKWQSISIDHNSGTIRYDFRYVTKHDEDVVRYHQFNVNDHTDLIKLEFRHMQSEIKEAEEGIKANHGQRKLSESNSCH